ncbi:DNA-binding NarL/FixJ family response regulator [Psychromicrobium silvestre]|uniref:DNA-binding NarL/FixJ family response regulator n=1 Tax=Psychromicrobium silvestre TaxID=1645614 RepID=A0A7Y9LR85_9MICC|nr:DNA-binding NarL/FixJ family response regulator [Psychromicrobium silvestre]
MLIESQPDLRFVGEAGDGAEALRVAAESRPEVILMDLRMPVMNGVIATAKLLADAGPEDPPKIIALTTFKQDKAIVDAMRAGASGYLLKSAEPEFLLATIRTVHRGHAVIAPEAAAAFFDRLIGAGNESAPDLSSISMLSGREQEVFFLVARGLGNVEVARELFLSEATVKSHVRSTLFKLGLKSRVQIVAFAYQHKLID